MQIPYTYWPVPEGGFVGYWNDYPDYLTEGDTLDDLRYMLRDLREGINVMVAEGESRPVPRHRETKETTARSILRALSAPSPEG